MAEGYKNDAVVIAGAAAAIGTLVVVAAHQLGALEHLSDPPGAVFGSDEITESEAAHPMGVPDSLPGIASYAVTFGLAIAARRSASLRQMLALKLVGDGALASFNVVRQVVQFGKICSWCTGTAMCTAVTLWAARGLLRAEVPAGIATVRELAREVD